MCSIWSVSAPCRPFEGAGRRPRHHYHVTVPRGAACSDSDDNASEFAAAAPPPATAPRRWPPARRRHCTDRRALPGPLRDASRCRPECTLVFASDADGVVNAASIIAGVTPGISLSASSARASDRRQRRRSPRRCRNRPGPGSYPLTVSFANEQGQAGQCAIAVNVPEPWPLASHRIPRDPGRRRHQPLCQYPADHRRRGDTAGGERLLPARPTGDGDPSKLRTASSCSTAACRPVRSATSVRLTATVTDSTPRRRQRRDRLTGVSRLTVISRGQPGRANRHALPLHRLTISSDTKACWYGSLTH